MKPYDLIIEENIANLKKAVNDAILRQFVPIGGITFVEGYYIQAVYNSNLR